MNIFTVSLFGHGKIERYLETESKLEAIIRDVIEKDEYSEFLVGREGEFDILASSVIHRSIGRYGYGNAHLTLALPYMKAEFRENMQSYLNFYDDVEVCGESSMFD